MDNNSEIDELKQELAEIKKLMQDINTKVTNIEELEETEIKHILSVKNMESEELTNLDHIKNLEDSELSKLHKMTPKKFNDITTWKSMIWNNCDARIMIDTEKIVTFRCTLVNKICSFEICPKNKFNPNEDPAKE